MLRVSEMFLSLDGEVNSNGILKPSYFIRLFGCNLNCPYCDTQYSRIESESTKPEWMPSARIVYKIEDSECQKITITGGEPLTQSETEYLIRHLLKQGYFVSTETNGSIPINFDLLWPDRADNMQRLSWIIDFKLDQPGRMHMPNFWNATCNDWIKFVIKDNVDFIRAKLYLSEFEKQGSKANIAFGPMIKPGENPAPKAAWLAKKILDHKLFNVTLNMQHHKIIWPDKGKGV